MYTIPIGNSSPNARIYRPFFQAQIDGTNNAACFSANGLQIDYTSASKFPAGTFSNTYSFTEVFTFNATTDGTGGIDVADIQIVQAGVHITTVDSNGNIITYKDSSGYSYEATYDSNGKELTYKNSNGVSRGFDKTYTPEEVEFIKRAVEYYWLVWYKTHPDNQNDLKLTEQILNK